MSCVAEIAYEYVMTGLAKRKRRKACTLVEWWEKVRSRVFPDMEVTSETDSLFRQYYTVHPKTRDSLWAFLEKTIKNPEDYVELSAFGASQKFRALRFVFDGANVGGSVVLFDEALERHVLVPPDQCAGLRYPIPPKILKDAAPFDGKRDFQTMTGKIQLVYTKKAAKKAPSDDEEDYVPDESETEEPARPSVQLDKRQQDILDALRKESPDVQRAIFQRLGMRPSSTVVHQICPKCMEEEDEPARKCQRRNELALLLDAPERLAVTVKKTKDRSDPTPYFEECGAILQQMVSEGLRVFRYSPDNEEHADVVNQMRSQTPHIWTLSRVTREHCLNLSRVFQFDMLLLSFVMFSIRSKRTEFKNAKTGRVDFKGAMVSAAGAMTERLHKIRGMGNFQCALEYGLCTCDGRFVRFEDMDDFKRLAPEDRDLWERLRARLGVLPTSFAVHESILELLRRAWPRTTPAQRACVRDFVESLDYIHPPLALPANLV